MEGVCAQSEQRIAGRGAQGRYRLEILDPTGQVVQTIADATLSKFGALAGTYAIPRSAAVGWYQFRLTAKFDEEIVRFPLRVLVSDFTPSPFGVRTQLNGDLFQAGDEVRPRRAPRCSRGAVRRRRSAHHGAARGAAVPFGAPGGRGVPVRHGHAAGRR